MRYLLLLLACVSQSAFSTQHFSQQTLAEFAKHSELTFAVESNQLEQAMQFNGSIRLVNRSAQPLPEGKADWQIYFHLIRHIAPLSVAGVQIEHVQGDLHRITPNADFGGLKPGQMLTLPFSSAPWLASYSDFMPRAFIVSAGLNAEVFANTDTEQLQQFVLPLARPEQLQRNFGEPDLVPLITAASRFEHNAQLSTEMAATDVWQQLLPTPLKSTFSGQTLTLNNNWQIQFDSTLSNEANVLTAQLKKLGITLTQPASSSKSAGMIKLAVDSNLALGAEGYKLAIAKDVITLTGNDNAGLFYAVQSLLALLQPQASQYLLPIGEITDAPRASWRGMHYDMARNFHSKDVTLRLIDTMARYKLNKLHLHLTEDEGWRLEIPGLPELTDIGAKRCFDLTEQQCLLTQLGTGPHASGSGNGYYSKADYIEILQYAAKNHIEVIPEIDLPGHARAAIVAMKARYKQLTAAGQHEAAAQYLLSDPNDTSTYLSVQNYTDNSANVCLESTYVFIDKVLSELQLMYQQAGVSFNIYHMGGDEVAKGSWQGSPACQQLISTAGNNVNAVKDLKPYFVSRVAALTQQRGLALAGWEDGLMYDQQNTFDRSQFANPQVIANAWDNIWEWGVADRAYRLANNGYQVVLSPGTHLYFDHPHEAHPDERGYYWATRYTGIDKVFGFMPDDLYANADTTRSGAPITDLAALVGRPLPALTQPQNILGIQGQVWSETIRTAGQLEQMIYPRLLALAERAWHKASWEAKHNNTAKAQDWQRFANRLGQVELAKLVALGSDVYLPPPGAIQTATGWQFNTLLPGLEIECSVDQGKQWQSCQHAKLSTAFWLRSRLGEVTSRTVIVTH